MMTKKEMEKKLKLKRKIEEKKKEVSREYDTPLGSVKKMPDGGFIGRK